MREKYVVLRTKELLAPTIERVGAAAPRMRRAGDAPQTIELSESQLSQAERADLRRDPRTQAIALSMPMKLIKPVADAEPSNETGSSTWGLAAVGADSSPFSGQGVNVAVLDTGIDAGHPAFAGVPMVQRNFTAESSDDTNGHGTHCAGTIFGQDVNGLRIGVARGINKAIIGKVLGAGGGGSAEIAQAINWAAAEGAHIISMSLGIDFPGYVNRLVGQSLPIQAATSLALEGYRANINLFTQLARL
ncbi:MAG: S8 family serine peptidase, partial [Pseudomonadota bacterium]